MHYKLKAVSFNYCLNHSVIILKGSRFFYATVLTHEWRISLRIGLVYDPSLRQSLPDSLRKSVAYETVALPRYTAAGLYGILIKSARKMLFFNTCSGMKYIILKIGCASGHNIFSLVFIDFIDSQTMFFLAFLFLEV